MTAASWSVIVGLAVAAWTLVMGTVIVLQRRSPAATIAWLLVLAFLPVIGLIIFRLIGPRRLERRKLRRQFTRRLVDEAVGTLAEIESDSPMRNREQLAHIAIAAGEAPPRRADVVELYTEGASTYAAIAEAFAAARHHIHLEYYIWEDDQIGRQLRDQLVLRAQAGLEVRILVDGTGSYGLNKKFLAPLIAAGAEIAWFNPVRLLRIHRKRADFRTHRKIIVCDGRVGFTGGMNIADAQTAEFSGEAAYRDTHLRIEGSATRTLQRVFVEDWMYATGRALPASERYFPVVLTAGTEVVQIVSSGPDLDTFAIHKVLFAAINKGVTRVWVTTPYFVPDDPILSALVSAAMRGVDVQVIVPARGDSRLVDLAARSYFPELLIAGARIFEYGPRFIHAKTLLVDDDIAIVGTANLDNRSFRLNFEVMAVVYGGTINARLDHAFCTDLEACREVLLPDLEQLPFFTRLGQAGARLLSPLL